eukprot:GAHX01001912.1.p1 GENE.GAHX01001912.1~~GAHX01001912.1.p1  ORF type:complete len:115 (-),score=19.22 GAHX01001912.1:27-371(-)
MAKRKNKLENNKWILYIKNYKKRIYPKMIKNCHDLIRISNLFKGDNGNTPKLGAKAAETISLLTTEFINLIIFVLTQNKNLKSVSRIQLIHIYLALRDLNLLHLSDNNIQKRNK